jgi:2-polyprenyl-6-methoxyphenol hydroxylase-like FAD-dependent oxidoreductase
LACWLAGYGFKPTLVERAPRFREGGYVIDLWGLGYDIAEKMGLLPDLERRAYRVDELRFVNDRGKRVGGFAVDIFRNMTSGRYISLPRSDLVKAIYRTIESRCEIVFDDSVPGIENTRDSVTVKFERSPCQRVRSRCWCRWSAFRCSQSCVWGRESVRKVPRLRHGSIRGQGLSAAGRGRVC